MAKIWVDAVQVRNHLGIYRFCKVASLDPIAWHPEDASLGSIAWPHEVAFLGPIACLDLYQLRFLLSAQYRYTRSSFPALNILSILFSQVDKKITWTLIIVFNIS